MTTQLVPPPGTEANPEPEMPDVLFEESIAGTRDPAPRTTSSDRQLSGTAATYSPSIRAGNYSATDPSRAISNHEGGLAAHHQAGAR